mmetsp:Transcript_14274/g.30972  ORF Transcript_14274/g.30972 Transcript_14274/m.30972 type:complete len:81 (-) Transcript_14274:18-260(-)
MRPATAKFLMDVTPRLALAFNFVVALMSCGTFAATMRLGMTNADVTLISRTRNVMQFQIMAICCLTNNNKVRRYLIKMLY